MNLKCKIYVAGHKGLVGSAIIRKLKLKGYKNILTVERNNLDLTNQKKVFNFLKKNKPETVIIAAAKVGGIIANSTYRADFIYQNLAIQNNLIHGSFINKINNLLFLGSSCIYPRHSKQPIKEEYLLQGALEFTNEPYAIAKIAGIKLCENYNFQYKTNYKCLMPSNIYGPGDNYDSRNSHFFAALIKKIHQAKIKKKKKIKLWGDGTPKREFIYVDDVAEACIFFMNKKIKENYINIGSGKDFTIKQYAKLLMKYMECNCKIDFDKTKPNGTPKKLLDISVAKKYGWFGKTSLKEGFLKTYKDFLIRMSK
jgi:GDP-L-fucose synthase